MKQSGAVNFMLASWSADIVTRVIDRIKLNKLHPAEAYIMNVMVLSQLGNLSDNPLPLTMMQMPLPAMGEQDLLIRVSVCGVCHTDLDEIEGRSAPAQLPVILGHQVVGTVEAMGTRVSGFYRNDRVGVAWIFTVNMPLLIEP